MDEILEFVDVKPGKEEAFADYLKGIVISPEGVKGWLETQDGKRFIQPILDKYHNKGLDTWKANNLESIIEDEVSKRNPVETEDQRRIRKLEQKLQEAENLQKRTKMESYAAQLAAQKGIPTELVTHFIGDDEESTESNIETLGRVVGDLVQAQVKTRFRDTGRQVQTTRTPSIGELGRLKDQYKEALDRNAPLQERIALTRRIQEVENMKE